MGIDIAEAKLRARLAFRQKVSATRWIQDMRARGLRLRDTTFYELFREANEREKKKGLMQHVRKDRYPTSAVMGTTTLRTPTEFTYILRVQSRISPDAPITKRMIGIPSDIPLTPMAVEELAWEFIKGQSPKLVAMVEKITAWEAMRRVYV